ncbi:alpha-ribazole transporter [Archaeoglobales archaeon ex4484_92]|nr:MAG: alpha-ribazole transporter [Archaeoglobales archaeon ex4484_92]
MIEDYKSYARVGLLIALSAIGGLIKIPSPVGSIALDSAPGYFAALIALQEGAIVATIGHLFSAYSAGFPLGLMHALIAGFMGVCAIVFGFVSRKSLPIGILIAIILNGIVGSFIVLPMGGLPFVLTLMPFLLLASAVNIIIASFAFKSISSI